MADEAAPSAHASRKPLHPFFAPNRAATSIAEKSKVNDAPGPNAEPLASSGSSDDRPVDDTVENLATQRSKRRKIASQDDDEEPKRPRGKKRAKPSPGGGIANHFIRLGTGTNSGPSDTTAMETREEERSPEFGVLAQDGHSDEAEFQEPINDNSHTALSENVNNSCPRVKRASTPKPGAAKTKKAPQPSSKAGPISSPPRTAHAEESREKDDDRENVGTPEGVAPSVKIAINQYGKDATSRKRIGNKVDAIISGKERHASSTTKSPPSPDAQEPKPASPRRITTPKRPTSTHPFFLGKAKKDSDIPVEEVKAKTTVTSPIKKKLKQFSSTPCSPKKPRVDGSNTRLPQFGVKNAGLKFPGSRFPAWPWRGMVHLRGDDLGNDRAEDVSLPLPLRKSKGHEVKVPASECIVQLVTQLLNIPGALEDVRNVNTDEFLPAPPELRLPSKHFESGQKLQSRIVPELRTFRLPAAAKRKAQRRQPADDGGRLQPPPQLARLFDSVSSGLSAFDKSQCETANWVQKYAPTSTIEVLQQGREQFLLREWLQALMVQSVDTGTADTDKGKPGSAKGKAPGPGKKKKRKKLDGFIVSSDDEDYGLYALSEDETDWAASGSRGIIRKTVVRPNDLSKSKDGEKIANALVISGPHGCGKTAAVYAVAKELDFEIFEINPGSKRSGKDVQEKIGDMTKNHLVRHHQSAAKDQEDALAEEETAKDIKLGKQSTMNAFFKPKAGTTNQKKPVKSSTSPQQKEAKKDSPKNQRQSLILIEEADILYEEDKQFWATITSLMVQSRRPFIITCNDETLLPLHSLRLHGIFRLTPPPQEYAVDRLILTAANEGHAITRQTAETLYMSRNEDLRAATMDLQLWCQMGVGDRRGGFEWFYPRWPKGVDLDENGQVVRVVSQGTYVQGMNWLGRDSVSNPGTSAGDAEEELLTQCWDFWGVDIGQWQDSTALSNWAENMTAITTTAQGRLKALEAFDGLAGAMSEADISARKSFATFKGELIDPTLPDPPAKAQDDIILGLIHIDTPSAAHFDISPVMVSSAIRSLAKSQLRASTAELGVDPSSDLGPLDEAKAISCIQSSFAAPAPEADKLSRIDFAFAFDPIATPDPPQMGPASYLDPSVFDRTFKMIILDVAPFVRSIVAYDSQLQKQRQKLSSLVSEGGRLTKGSKRMRTTRAALSALEGSSRSTTRGQTWFTADLNPHLVMKTAPRGSLDSYLDGTEIPSTPETSPVSLSPASSPASPKPAKKLARRGRPRKGVIKEDSVDELGDNNDASAP